MENYIIAAVLILIAAAVIAYLCKAKEKRR